MHAIEPPLLSTNRPKIKATSPIALYYAGETEKCYALASVNRSHHLSVIYSALSLKRMSRLDEAWAAIADYEKRQARHLSDEKFAELLILKSTVLTEAGQVRLAREAMTSARAYVIGSQSPSLFAYMLTQNAMMALVQGDSESAFQLATSALLVGNRLRRFFARQIQSASRAQVGDFAHVFSLVDSSLGEIMTLPWATTYIATGLHNSVLFAVQQGAFERLDSYMRIANQLAWPASKRFEQLQTYLNIAEGARIVGDDRLNAACLQVAALLAKAPSECLHVEIQHALSSLSYGFTKDALRHADRATYLAEHAGAIRNHVNSKETLLLAQEVCTVDIERGRRILNIARQQRIAARTGYDAAEPLRTEMVLLGATGMLCLAERRFEEARFHLGVVFEYWISITCPHIAAYYAFALMGISQTSRYKDFLQTIATEYPHGETARRLNQAFHISCSMP